MRVALMIEPQMGLSYADQLAVARRAEAAGLVVAMDRCILKDHRRLAGG